jgi:hypothetical protein
MERTTWGTTLGRAKFVNLSIDLSQGMGHLLLGRNQINIMHISNLLQLDIPFSQLLGSQILAIPLMRDVMVLAEHTSQITHAKEHRPAAMVTLDAWLLAKMRRDHINLDRLGADQTHAGFFVAVDAAFAWA